MSSCTTRRQWMVSLLAVAAGGSLTRPALAGAEPGLPLLQVWKSPSCGCCTAWVQHLQTMGFRVSVHPVEDTTAMRRRLGLPDRYGSCHTAQVGGYVIEGHVPAVDIKRLLAQKPEALGLAVPGMPVGSPGMEMGSRLDPYEVLLVDRQGRAKVYARYG